MSLEPEDIQNIRQIGKYPVERFLAEGGMAWVFRVHDPDLFKAPRALKLLKPQAAQGEDFQRFTAEAQILATIKHPNLIHVYDVGKDDGPGGTGCHFYTMDFIEGKTLEDIPPTWLDDDDEEEEEALPQAVSEEAEVDPNATSFIQIQQSPAKTRFTVHDVCEYFCGVAAALSRLHRENVVHRDIKPENIFLSDDGMAVLGDLGIAKGRHSSGITEIGRVPGTPLFMSPEHAMGDQTTVKSDIFSLGLSLYSVLSGETIYDQIEEVEASDSNSVLRYLLSLATDGAEFDFIFDDSIPDSVCDVIEKACAIKEADRYASADEFDEALRIAIDGTGETAGGGIRPALVAAIAIPILAVGGYFGSQLLSQGDKAVVTEEAAARTISLGKETQRLLARLTDLADGPESSLLETATGETAQAHKNSDDGKKKLDDRDYDLAQQMFVRAQTGYERVCEDLTLGFLEQGTPPRVKEARNVRDQVEPTAEQIVPRDWAELETLTASFDRELPPSGCARAQGLWARIDLATQVVAKSREVSAEMSRRLPEVSETSLAAAEEARGVARAFQSESNAYRSLMKVASTNLGSARSADLADDFSTSIRRSKQAKDEFDRAANVRPSTEARTRLRKLMVEIEAEGVRLGGLRERELTANRSYGDGEYVKAATEYRGLLDETEALSSAASTSLAARKAADVARKDAEGWAVPVRFLSGGEALYARANMDLGGGEFDSSEQLFREAMASFQEGKRKAAEEGVIDSMATNANALRQAQVRAEEAEKDRLAEDERRASERREAEARALVARQELDALRIALEEAKNAPVVTQVVEVATEDAGLRKAMKEYETAYESRSIEDLNRVWSMSRFERLQIQRLFDDCGQIRVQVSFADSNIAGATARVDYDETIVFKECQNTRSGSRYSELSASLARRGDSWQIKKIRQR